MAGCEAVEVNIEDVPDIISGHVPCDLLVRVDGCSRQKAEGIWGDHRYPLLHITDGLVFA